MAFGIGAPGQLARGARRRGPVQDARRVPRADAADHPAGAGRHHADVGQHQPRADDPRAAVRRLARHPGRPGQRHDRRPPRPGLALRRAAARARSARPASTTSSAATSTARPRSGPSGPNLGLYSVTFNNDLAHDLRHARAVPRVPRGGRAQGVPLLPRSLRPQRPGRRRPRRSCPRYINDMIARMLAGVAPAGRPLFLKIVYHGPKAMEELVRYDPHLVVGILGGSAGHDPRRLPAPRRRPEVRGQGRPLRPQDQQRREPARLRPVPPPDRRRRDRPGRGGQGVSRRPRQARASAPQRPLEDDLKLQADRR